MPTYPTLSIVLADFNTILTSKLAIGDDSATIAALVDDDGVALAEGQYFLTLDASNAQKEHIVCDLSIADETTTIENIRSVSRAGVITAGVVREHRVGGSVIGTDHGHIKFLNDLLDGTTKFDPAVPLGYDSTPPDLDNDPQNFTTIESIQNSQFEYFEDTGAANALVITPTPAIPSYAAGQKFAIKAIADNTGSTTLNVNGLGAKDILKSVDQSLSAGDILEGQIIVVYYDADGDSFQLVGGPGGGSSGGGGSFSGASVTLTAPTGSSPIGWDNEYFDTDSYHSNVTNNSRLTIPATGNYIVTANVSIVTVANNDVVGIRLKKNGSTVLAQSGATINAPHTGGYSIAGVFAFTAGDYIEIEHYDFGSGVTVNTESVFSIVQVGTLLTKKTTILTGAVLTLNGTPVELLPAPPSGHAYQILGVVGRIVFNSVAYTTNLNLQVKVGGTALASNSDLLADGSTTIRQFILSAGTILAATATTLSVATGNPAAGNSPIDIYLTYRLITL